MNEEIRRLIKESDLDLHKYWNDDGSNSLEEFAELILEECRKVLTEEYQKTPIQCCGHLLRLDEAILEHFYGVNNEQHHG